MKNFSAEEKRQFVMSLPMSTPATEVITRAKARGMAIGKSSVYQFRSESRMIGSPDPVAPAPKPKRKSPRRAAARRPARNALVRTGGPKPNGYTNGTTSHAPVVPSSHEDQLARIILDIGIGQTRALLDTVHSRFLATLRLVEEPRPAPFTQPLPLPVEHHDGNNDVRVHSAIDDL